MKYRVLLAVGTAISLYFSASTQQAVADVTADYRPATIIGGRPYTSLVGRTVLPATSFRLPPQLAPTDAADRDDGYVQVTMPFQFSYNGGLYSSVWISINGFVMFTNTTPPNLTIDNPQSLFTLGDPRNIIAPFFGDHYYRTGNPTPDGIDETGYQPSEISYGTRVVDGRNAFVVQWANLNINNESIASSIANFQLFLYESDSSRAGSPNFQGDIEFAYGTIGGNGSQVITQGAAIGIKGENGDYINALVFNGNINTARTSTERSNLYPPSGGTDQVIRLSANIRLLVAGWGDGDADLSQTARHAGLPQNRFVTVNDSRTILRAQARNIRLDSVRERNAFHGDVNHNGRYYYSTRNRANTADSTRRNQLNTADSLIRYRRAVEVRTLSDFDLTGVEADNSLPFLNGNPSFFFEATEYDASLIMLYMSGRIPTLPWLLDTIIPYGRAGVNDKYADDIVIGSPVKISENVYRIAVQLNGTANGAIATKLAINGEIIEANGVELGENKVLVDFNGNTVVIAATGDFNASEAVAYITVKTDANFVDLSNIRFNDKQKSDVKIMVKEDGASGTESLQNNPNPFTGTTSISYVIPQVGNYELAIYDMLGNKVKTLTAGEMSEGPQVIEWNGTDATGKSVSAGNYIYRLQGEGVTFTKTMVVVR